VGITERAADAPERQRVAAARKPASRSLQELDGLAQGAVEERVLARESAVVALLCLLLGLPEMMDQCGVILRIAGVLELQGFGHLLMQAAPLGVTQRRQHPLAQFIVAEAQAVAAPLENDGA